MEQAYWLARKRASVANARRAGGAEARLVHLDLAGRYSVKAAAAAALPEREGARLALPPPLPEGTEAEHYQRLETGARWLASRSANTGAREEHLGMANRYARLRLAATEKALT
jgi:hypothetical protein